MALLEINRNPDERTLRQFGRIAAAALPTAGWWFGGNVIVIAALLTVGAALAAMAQFQPPALRRPFIGLSLATAPIGMIVGEVLVAVLYYGVFVPVGLVFKLLRRDALERKFVGKATTYWQPIRRGTAHARYFRQF